MLLLGRKFVRRRSCRRTQGKEKTENKKYGPHATDDRNHETEKRAEEEEPKEESEEKKSQ